jgi:hypothetical protein
VGVPVGYAARSYEFRQDGVKTSNQSISIRQVLALDFTTLDCKNLWAGKLAFSGEIVAKVQRPNVRMGMSDFELQNAINPRQLGASNADSKSLDGGIPSSCAKNSETSPAIAARTPVFGSRAPETEE